MSSINDRKSTIQLVSFDLDLTLVDASACVTPAVRAAFRKARDLGEQGRTVVEAICAFIATGEPSLRPDRVRPWLCDGPLLDEIRVAFAGNDGDIQVTSGAATVMEHLSGSARVVVITN